MTGDIESQSSVQTPIQNYTIHFSIGASIIFLLGLGLIDLGWSNTHNDCLTVQGESVAWYIFAYGICIISSIIFCIAIIASNPFQKSSGIFNTGRRRITASVLSIPAGLSAMGTFCLPFATFVLWFGLPDCAYDYTVFITIYIFISIVLNPLLIIIIGLLVWLVYECMVAKE